MGSHDFFIVEDIRAERFDLGKRFNKWNRAKSSGLKRKKEAKLMDSLNVASSMKFDPPLFDGKIDYALWQITIQDILVYQGLDSTLYDKKVTRYRRVSESLFKRRLLLLNLL